jgi:wyosine [tRNA(Phe)-imidazoG37] synthetase (radical SAM superfamily)
MVLGLQHEVIYGPIQSRRLGRSLGVNLSPVRDKMCSFDCVYCHYGPTRRLTIDPRPFVHDLPTVAEVAEAVEAASRSELEFDFITFSGNGEPTIHPDFPEIARTVAEIRTRLRPEARLALLSNSTGLTARGVHRALEVIDVPVLKLDAGTSATMQAVNRPAPGVFFDDILEALVSCDGIILQTLLVDGSPNNTSRSELGAYFRCVEAIAPHEVHIYSTDRPVGHRGIACLPRHRLDEIADQGSRATGIPFQAFSA